MNKKKNKTDNKKKTANSITFQGFFFFLQRRHFSKQNVFLYTDVHKKEKKIINKSFNIDIFF